MSKYKKTEILIVLLSAFTLFLIASFVYLNFFYEEAKKENGINYIEIDKSSNLYKVFDDLIETENFENIAKLERNVVDFNNITNEEKLNIVFDSLKEEKEDVYENGISLDLMNEYFSQVFKDEIIWDKEDIECWCGTPIFIYDEKSNRYIYNPDHLGHGVGLYVSNYFNKVISISEYNNYYRVTVVSLWKLNHDYPEINNKAYDTYAKALGEIYPLFEVVTSDEDYTDDVILSEINKNFDDYKDEMAKYIYTFEKVNEKYLLVSFEFEDR